MPKSGSRRKKKAPKKSTGNKSRPKTTRSVETTEEDVTRTYSVDESERKLKKVRSSSHLDPTVEERSVEVSSKNANRRESRELVSKQQTLTKAVFPQTFFHVVDVDYEIPKGYQYTEVSMPLTLSLVVISISHYSPFFPYLVVGDQIIEVNGTPMLNADQFKKIVFNENYGKLRVVRPWNVTHLGDRLPKKRNKNCSYAVVEIHQLTGKPRGLGAEVARGGLIRNIKPRENAAHGFIYKDRILDVEHVPVKSLSRSDVRETIDQNLAQQKRCSFLVERPPTLRSSPNASLTAARFESPQPIGMGDDACEIGAREATRIREMKDRYKPKPLCKVAKPSSSKKTTSTITEDEGDKKKKTKKKKPKRSVSFADRSANSISHTPSDVKDTSKLLTVGPNRSTLFNSFRDKSHPTKRI